MDTFRRWRRGLHCFLRHSRCRRKMGECARANQQQQYISNSMNQLESLEDIWMGDAQNVELVTGRLSPSYSKSLRLSSLRSLSIKSVPTPPHSRGSLLVRSWSSASLHGLTRRSSGIQFESYRSVTMKTPKGYVAVYVGQERERFLIPIGYLSHPDFRELLEEAKDAFGLSQKAGLRIPCTPFDFEHKLRVIQRERDTLCISVLTTNKPIRTRYLAAAEGLL